MKRIFLPSFVLAMLFSSTHSFAQGSNKAFAITSQVKGSYAWNVVREIDMATGEIIKTIYDPAVNTTVQYKAVPGSDLSAQRMANPATANGVAAAAYDAKHNRLYFTNMRGNDLSYFDLSTNDINVVVNTDPSFNTGNKFDEANVITRMAFGSDGFGYAITNDGKSLIRFTTDQKPKVTNLGELIDGKKNGTMSVHSQCSSWGGDMVGDAFGNLYLVSYRNHIFKINPDTRIADYVGQIKGLPEGFTTNGMAVTASGDLFISSAILTDNYYAVNVSTLEARIVPKKDDKVFNASDLASNHLLYEKNVVKKNDVITEVKGNQLVSIYPNPVEGKTFTVQFDKVPSGNYNLLLTDASGRSVLAKSLNISMFGQVERISLPRSSAGGIYLIKLTGSNGKSIYSDKIVVQ